MPNKANGFARPPPDSSDRPPPLEVRYFYCFSRISQLPIDDPLAPISPATAPASASFKQPSSPFSDSDNAAIEKLWNELRQKIRVQEDKQRRESGVLAGGTRSEALENLGTSVRSRDGSNTRRRSHGGEGALHRPASRQIQLLSPGKAKPDGNDADSESPSRTSRRSSRAGSLKGDAVPDDRLGMTGNPFVRATSRSRRLPSPWDAENHIYSASDQPRSSKLSSKRREIHDEEDKMKSSISSRLPVGVSQLHQVLLPSLIMEPIYWQPVNDTANVLRATWFYKNSMLPVEMEVANMLECGYISLRPWTQTWKDELNSAVEAGAAGEEKIVVPLWPEPPPKTPSSRPSTSMSHRMKDDDDSPEKRQVAALAAACEIIDNASKGQGCDNKAAGTNEYGSNGQSKLYRRSLVLYLNERYACVLSPGLGPSPYYGRRPLANYIRKGYNIGIPVIRGFDKLAWEALNRPSKGKLRREASRSASSGDVLKQPAKNPKQVTDLILVVHGIGQKIAERVESFNFTLSMNTFRREMNVEMNTASVKGHFRDDMGGMMVLPVNWRSTLSFEEGGFRDDTGSQSVGHFSLKDITPESLPSIRNIVSDVMLDIPYYLSHHQPAMIRAVIFEANRIYKLWCTNNPGFEQYGRVHLLAHSLGSVMAMDILSNQPTRVSDGSVFETYSHELPHFAFDTHNLFLAGSPTGFFLLLKQASLLPRKNRRKATLPEDNADGVAAEVGTYGCLAVENIYNIINPYDPVAYRLNAAIDAVYAASIKPAIIPSAASPWFSFGNPFSRDNVTAATASTSKAVAQAANARPTHLLTTTHLPSQVELETHNFSREELAEKRAHLLNDNGQVDFFLRYGGGPLEIQYLTMLGAHSSYWLSRDFIRFLVVETGRESGREASLQGARAVKKGAR